MGYRRICVVALLFILSGQISSANAYQRQKADKPQILPYRVVKEYPHDTASFTEGFLFHKKQLYESTGSPDDMPDTRSYIGPVNLKTGKVLKQIELERDTYFGEGIVFLDGKLFQLTYTSKLCFVYDETTFKRIGEFKFSNTEGWGLTTDGKHLIMSDGTSTLTYLNPNDFSVVKTLKVTENDQPLDNLNELEYINGFIYANVWYTNNIVKIDPATGKVTAILDLTPIQEKEKSKNPRLDFLNGIAFDPSSDKILITGKLWSTIYEIDFVH